MITIAANGARQGKGGEATVRVILNYFSEFLQMIPTIGFWDVLDILVVAFIVYKGINMIHSSAASRIIRSIVALLLLTALTSILKMRSLNYILDKILELGIIALVVIFQPELRRALERFNRELKDVRVQCSASAELSAFWRAYAACVDGFLNQSEEDTP